MPINQNQPGAENTPLPLQKPDLPQIDWMPGTNTPPAAPAPTQPEKTTVVPPRP